MSIEIIGSGENEKSADRRKEAAKPAMLVMTQAIKWRAAAKIIERSGEKIGQPSGLRGGEADESSEMTAAAENYRES